MMEWFAQLPNQNNDKFASWLTMKFVVQPLKSKANYLVQSLILMRLKGAKLIAMSCLWETLAYVV